MKFAHIRVSYYLLDDKHNNELVKEEIFSGKEFSLYLSMKLFDTVLIRFSPI